MPRVLATLILLLGAFTARAQSFHDTAADLAAAEGVPGVAWAVFLDGAIETGGFGTADRDARLPVDPDSTVFRVASVSKVFTATLAARLEREGVVDLDRDVSADLPWLPADHPLTLRQLLTHTSGIEDRTVGMFARTPEDVAPLEEYLAEGLPARSMPPGEAVRYSNHGAALAGLLAARAWGSTFAEAMEDRVFREAGMTSSSFAQPPSPDILARLARAYACETCEAEPFDWRHAPPAGAMLTTAADMGRYMQRVLTDSLWAPALMGPVVRMHPDLPGITLALAEQDLNGIRALGHAGSSSGYKALLLLVPSHKAGLFLATTGGPTRIGQRMVEAFTAVLVERTGPATQPNPPHRAEASHSGLAPYTAAYLSLRSPLSSAETFPAIFHFTESILEGEGAVLRLEGGQWTAYEPVGDDLFRSTGGAMWFARDAEDEVAGMHGNQRFFGIDYPASFVRLPGWKAPRVLNEVFSWVMGLPLLVTLFWPIGVGVTSLVRTLRGRRRRRRRRMATGRRMALWLASLLAVVPMTVFGFGYLAKMNAALGSRPMEVVYGLPSSMVRLEWLPWMCAGTTVLAVLACLYGWRRRAPWLDRVTITITAVGAVGFSILLVHFNLLPLAR